MARYVGPPPRPTLPPRPWKSVTSTPALRQAATSDLLGLVELPVRGEPSAVLRRVGVADHHFLPAAGSARGTRASPAGPRGSCPPRRGRHGLEQRHDAQRRRAPASFCSSSTASTSDGRSAIEMMYAPSDSGGSPAATRNVSRTSARRATEHRGRDERAAPAAREQERLPRGLAPRVVGAEPQLARDGRQRLRVARRVLPDVEPHERRAERRDAPQQIAQPSAAMRPSPVCTSERWQSAAARRAPRRSTTSGHGRAAPAGEARLDVAQRRVQPIAHVAQQRAVRLVGAPTRAPQLVAASFIDSSSRSASTSRRYRLAPATARAGTTVSVTAAVTRGCRRDRRQSTSRSGAASVERQARPVCLTSAASSTRRKRGNASHSVCSKTTMPERASSTGDGRSRRTSLVSHAAAISMPQRVEQLLALGRREVRPIAQREQLRDAAVLLHQRAPRDLGRDAP